MFEMTAGFVRVKFNHQTHAVVKDEHVCETGCPDIHPSSIDSATEQMCSFAKTKG